MDANAGQLAQPGEHVRRDVAGRLIDVTILTDRATVTVRPGDYVVTPVTLDANRRPRLGEREVLSPAEFEARFELAE
jgi:hypothetical protein